MSEYAVDPDNSVESSVDADVAAGYDDPDSAEEAPLSDPTEEGTVQDSHAADVDAAYDDDSDSPTIAGSSGPGA